LLDDRGSHALAGRHEQTTRAVGPAEAPSLASGERLASVVLHPAQSAAGALLDALDLAVHQVALDPQPPFDPVGHHVRPRASVDLQHHVVVVHLGGQKVGPGVGPGLLPPRSVPDRKAHGTLLTYQGRRRKDVSFGVATRDGQCDDAQRRQPHSGGSGKTVGWKERHRLERSAGTRESSA
jgi:hypothetical protein